MKNTKKYLSLFLILAMIMSSITVFCVSATQLSDDTDVIVTDTEDVVIEHELVPMMASGCPTYGQGGYKVERGEIPDTSGHNQYGACTYVIYYYSDGSSYGIYTYERYGIAHVQMYSDGSIYNSWWVLY